jgi:hypothetical protein
MSRLVPVLFVLLAACASERAYLSEKGTTGDGDTGNDTADTGDSGDTSDVPDTSMWDGSTLVVTSPEPGEFIPLGEMASFKAKVYDANGDPTDFDEIAWSSSIDTGWSLAGASVESDGLSAGSHVITAQATLPNGDHLAWAVGGVLVQDEEAGTYFGDLMVDLSGEYEGQTYTATCIGAANLIVATDGQSATGDSTCTVSLMGYDMDAAHMFDFAVDNGDVSGTATIDLSYVGYDFDVAGSVGGGDLVATWSDDIYGYVQVAAELDVTRVSRDTEPMGR